MCRKLVAIGADGASVNFGKKGGIIAAFRKRIRHVSWNKLVKHRKNGESEPRITCKISVIERLSASTVAPIFVSWRSPVLSTQFLTSSTLRSRCN